MNTIKELKQKGQELKRRVAKFGAPMGNTNAAGPHGGRAFSPGSVGRTPSGTGSLLTPEKLALGKKIATGSGSFRLDGYNYQHEDRPSVLNGWRYKSQGWAHKLSWVLVKKDANK